MRARRTCAAFAAALLYTAAPAPAAQDWRSIEVEGGLTLQAGLPGPDRSKPPVLAEGSGGFKVEQLPGPVVVDGSNWVAAEPLWPGKSAGATQEGFTIALSSPLAEGDVERARLVLHVRTGSSVTLVPDPVSYALLSRDSRWVFTEPLVAIDLQSWRRHDLSKVFSIAPYIAPMAVAADGRRIVVSRRDCAADCPPAAVQYWLVTLP